MKQLSKEEWLSLKASVADAFGDLYKAECNGTLPEGQVENLKICVNALNDFLEKDTYDEQPDKESEELESIRKTSEHIGTNVKLWLSVNSPDEAIEVLTECENQIEESDKEKWETLHEVTSLIAQIKKDVQNEDRR